MVVTQKKILCILTKHRRKCTKFEWNSVVRGSRAQLKVLAMTQASNFIRKIYKAN